MKKTQNKISSAPPSATSNIINWTGLGCATLALFLCREFDIRGLTAICYVLFSYAIPILALEVIFLRTPWRESAGLDFSQEVYDLKRVVLKMVGLYGSVAFIALLYWIFPEYHGDFYRPYWVFLEAIAPWFFLISIPYVVFMDAKSKDPHDSYWHFGKLLMVQWEGINRKVITQHLLGWVVKGFFFPLMLIAFGRNVNYLTNFDFSTMTNFITFFNYTVSVFFTVDLLAAVAGYFLSIRLFDTHIRTSEPTLLGWFVCLICYQPFQSTVMRYYLAYSGNSWIRWLDAYPTVQVLWGSIALVLLAVYTYASLNFGCRFSNLTNRGVLTKGAYRLTKHPAYVSKNAYWWMVHIPFLPTQGWLEMVRQCLLMLGVNLVYYLRARTEERHLSRDPDYVRYALWMNDHSLFSECGKWLPFLKYKAPENLPPLK